jgi:biotin carboxyl carrier protein
MRYHAILKNRERLIEVTARGGQYRVSIHPGPEASEQATPRVLTLDVVHVRGNGLSLLAGTRSHAAAVDPGKDFALSVLVDGQVHALELLDERKLRMRRAGGKFSLDGPQRIDAPMPGKIVRVLVKMGEAVLEGQGLVVVEAMKMENELKSPKAGTVAELHAVEGAAVESGAKLLVVA